MFTLDVVVETATELLFGSQPANVMFALQIAALSAQQSLAKNGIGARILSDYVTTQLPERETLYQLFKIWKMNINNTHLNAIYHAQYLRDSGQLDTLPEYNGSLLTQMAWRDAVYELYHPMGKGQGMAWKTISMAHLLLCPLTSQLVPVDRHHLARLGYADKGVGYKPTYLKMENLIREELANSVQPNMPLCLWAWWQWEEWRQQYDISAIPGIMESHINLSCRAYK